MICMNREAPVTRRRGVCHRACSAPAAWRWMCGWRLAFLAAVGLVASPVVPPAQAQTTALWNATLTVGSTTSGGQTTFGYRPSVPGSQQGFGSLSPNTFTRGTATVNVIRLVYNSGASGTLDFQISLASGTIPPDGLLGAVGLVLTLGSETFAFTPGTSLQFDFDRGGLSWNDGDTVAVSLAIAAPDPPTALQAAPYGDTAVLLSWTTPATGTPGGYKVEVSEDAGITWADAEDDTGSTDTSWIHEGLPAAATRHYRVSALVSGEASDPSATASATTCAAGVPWCPTLTAGTTIFGGATFTGFSSTFPSIGSISPASFQHGGSTYTSDQLVHTDLTGSPTLILGFDSAPPAGFALRSGAQVLALASATYDGTNVNYTWSTPPFGPWSNGQVVAFEFAATFTPPNTAPVITTTSPISVPENTTAVTTLAATDADTGTTLTWSKNGGADADAFTLTSAGVLTFATAPDYENPTDTGGDNSYVVIVQVFGCDGHGRSHADGQRDRRGREHRAGHHDAWHNVLGAGEHDRCRDADGDRRR